MSCLKYIAIFILPISLIEINASDAQTLQQNQDQCQLCLEIVNGILDGLGQGATDIQLANGAIEQCKGRQLQLPYVCEGVIMKNMDIAAFILRNRPNITSQFICSIIFQGKGCPRNESDNPVIPVIIDSNRPKLYSSKCFIPSYKKGEEITVVQLTDTHTDRDYEVGANAVCYATVCCRKSQGPASDPINGAGKWGDYRYCDPPLEAFINVLQRINSTHKKIDYIYYTGDTVDHGVWETSPTSNQEKFEQTFDLIQKYLPNIPIIPIIGNHESHPVNQFSPANTSDYISSVAMYKYIANYWKWLPLDARKSIEAGGYYTMLLRKGLRIIAMNNNDCFIYNLWLLYDPTFPTKQMQWLHDTLLLAERNKEKVHLLAHIPTNDKEYYNVFSPVFRKIVDRFWNTISLIFNGHTHFDEFTLFYSLDMPNIAVNVAWNGGSTTPYSNVNPNYKVYTIEPKTYQVVNQEVYIYNLTQANNQVGSPKWFKVYDFLQGYGVRDLSPASLDKLLDEMVRDPEKLELYWKLKVKLGDPSLKAGCSDECLLDHLCHIIDTGSKSERCEKLSRNFQRKSTMKRIFKL